MKKQFIFDGCTNCHKNPFNYWLRYQVSLIGVEHIFNIYLCDSCADKFFGAKRIPDIGTPKVTYLGAWVSD